MEALQACEVKSCVALVILEVGIDPFCKEHVYHVIVSLHRREDKKRIVFLIQNVIQISLIPFQHVFHQPTVSGGDGCVHALHKLGGLFFLLHIPKLREMLTPGPWSTVNLLPAGTFSAAFNNYYCLILKTNGIASFANAALTLAAHLSDIILFIIERLHPPDSAQIWRRRGHIQHRFVGFLTILSVFENALESLFFNYCFDLINILINSTYLSSVARE